MKTVIVTILCLCITYVVASPVPQYVVYTSGPSISMDDIPSGFPSSSISGYRTTSISGFPSSSISGFRTTSISGGFPSASINDFPSVSGNFDNPYSQMPGGTSYSNQWIKQSGTGMPETVYFRENGGPWQQRVIGNGGFTGGTGNYPGGTSNYPGGTGNYPGGTGNNPEGTSGNPGANPGGNGGDPDKTYDASEEDPKDDAEVFKQLKASALRQARAH